MKILVTGAKGFVGKNLCINLKNKGYTDVYEYDLDTPEENLELWTKDCDFVFNLAGVNRPINKEEFIELILGIGLAKVNITTLAV